MTKIEFGNMLEALTKQELCERLLAAFVLILIADGQDIDAEELRSAIVGSDRLNA